MNDARSEGEARTVTAQVAVLDLRRLSKADGSALHIHNALVILALLACS